MKSKNFLLEGHLEGFFYYPNDRNWILNTFDQSKKTYKKWMMDEAIS